MRLSARRVLQWFGIFALLQLVVYYWAIKRPRVLDAKVQPHKFLDSISKEDGTCSFKNCPEIKEGVINVHLVPHSHIDVGWLKTVDQYYTGDHPANAFTAGCVRCTLNTTILELLKDPSRRFIFIEMKYFSRFWEEADGHLREQIRKLIKERRLEIVNGGWVMSDAGVTTYNDIIDQHTLGFNFIRDTFGSCAQSRTGWHVDQFGHSREHASLFAQMGYDSLFIGRLDFQDLNDRKLKQNLEFVWKTSPRNLGDRSTLFVQTTYDGYYAPADYVFDNGHLMQTDSNVLESSALNLIKLLQDRARSFKTNHLLVPMGSDFGYKDADRWYVNMDALIRKVNTMTIQDNSQSMRLNLLYSTPSCYTYHVNKARQVFETKSDDFYPYGISPGVYWSGYFTTRGGFKMHIRRAGQILQTCKHLSIFASLDGVFENVNSLRDIMAVMQHHDAITGTQTQLVLQDYNLALSKAEEQCQNVISMAYKRLWSVNSDVSPSLNPQFCLNLNMSSCDVSENSKKFVVSIYSPLSWTTDFPVRLPVKFNKVLVTDSRDRPVPVQLVPVPEGVRHIPERQSTAEAELVFTARLPPMSVTSYNVKIEGDGPKPTFLQSSASDIVIENEHLSLSFSARTGKLISMYNKDSQVKEDISQDFAYYISQPSAPRASGAYVFVPLGSEPKLVAPGEVEIKLIKGKVVQEVHQMFSNWAYQIVRLHEGAKYAEFQWVVGPLDDNMGKEVVSKFTTSLNSDDKFYTDSNGREIMQRIREKPGSTKVKDYVSGNYYPITSRIFIQDVQKHVQLTIIPDRPQGGSSLHSGSLELMVHRRLLFDDGLGVAEALKDQGINNRGIIFSGKHYVCLDTIENSVLLTKHLGLQVHLAPVLTFTPLNGSSFDGVFTQHTFLSDVLPDNIHILTLDVVSSKDTNMYLLRLEHVFEVGEHPVLSQPAELSLQNLFQPFDIVSAEETTLGGNFRPHEITRLEWKTVDGPTQSNFASSDYKTDMEPPFTIKLQPMEIRTFRVQVARGL